MDTKAGPHAKDLSGIFSDALLIAGQQEQEQYLRKNCGDHEELLEGALKLLRAHHASSEAFEQPFFAIPELSNRKSHLLSDKLPRPFGEYELLEIIGQGGMGIVFKATQTRLQRTVALKMVRNSQFATLDELKRFRTEAKAAASLQHSAIVPVIETGKIDGQYFYSMGYIDGVDLAEAFRKNLIPSREVPSILKKITAGVAYAHRKGIVHRDLKPENILLSQNESEGYDPHISDFGLARRLDDQLDLTIPGTIFGSPGYMSPEQADGSVDAKTHLTDIYSIGALMFFLLTGRPPYQGSSIMEILQQVKNNLPPRLSSIDPTINKDLDTICQKCLEKDPAQRYQSAEKLLEDLENFENHRPLLAKPTGLLFRLRKFCRRHPLATKVGLVATILLGGLIYTLVSLANSQKQVHSAINQANSVTHKLTESERTNLKLGLNSQFKEIVESITHQEIEKSRASLFEIAHQCENFGFEPLEKKARQKIVTLANQLWTAGPEITDTNIEDFQISPSGDHIALIHPDGNIHLRETSSGKTLLRHQLPSKLTASAFHPSGRIFVGYDQEFHLHVWEFSGEEAYQYRSGWKQFPKNYSNRHPISSIGFSLSGETLYTIHHQRTLEFWEFPPRQKHSRRLAIHFMDSPLIHTELSPLADQLFTLDEKGTVRGWNLSRGVQLPGIFPTMRGAKSISVDRKTTNLLMVSPASKKVTHFKLPLLTKKSGAKISELSQSIKIIQGKQQNALISISENQSFIARNLSTSETFPQPLKFDHQIMKTALNAKEDLLFALSVDRKMKAIVPPASWRGESLTPPKGQSVEELKKWLDQQLVQSSQ